MAVWWIGFSATNPALAAPRPRKGKTVKLRAAPSSEALKATGDSESDGVVLDVVVVKRRIVQPDGTMRVVTTAQ